jgi:hypothetical protein
MSDENTLFCANHPQTPTSLRCNRCEKPICTRCAVLTPTGYRCKECVRGQQKIFDTANWYDYPLAVLAAAGLSFIGSQIVPRLGFFALFLAPIAGVIIAEAVRALVRRRRSRQLFTVAAAAAAIGSLPSLISLLVIALAALSQGGLGILLSLIWNFLYTVIVTTTVYTRLSGIQIGR